VSWPVDLQRFRNVVKESPNTSLNAICLAEVRVYGIFLNGLILVCELNLRKTALFYLLEDYKVLIVTNWFELRFDPSVICSKLEVQSSHNVRTLLKSILDNSRNLQVLYSQTGVHPPQGYASITFIACAYKLYVKMSI
jgi:hypothetical protein